MNEQKRQTAPPYSEEQVTRWLAFLARGMTEHDQTIFLIERLQPSWLPARWQRWVYVLASRLIWGILAGLIFGLIFNLRDLLIVGLYDGSVFEGNMKGSDQQFINQYLLWSVYSSLDGHLIVGVFDWLIIGLIFGLLFGLVFGLSDGLIDVIRTGSKCKEVAQNSLLFLLRRVWRSVLVGLPIALTFGLTASDLLAGLAVGLIVGLIAGSSLWLIDVIRTHSKHSRSEVLKPSLRQMVWKSVTVGFIVGLIVGLVPGLFVDDLIAGLLIGLSLWLVVGLSLSLSFWLPVVVPMISKRIQSELGKSPLVQIVWGTVLVGLISGATVWQLGEVNLGLIFGLNPGLIFGLIWILRAPSRMRRAEIETVETIRFLRNAFQRGFRYGLIAGLLVGLIVWWVLWIDMRFRARMLLLAGYEVGPIDRVHLLLIIWLRLALIFGVIVGLGRSFQPVIRELKTTPNQGIWLSLRSAGLMGSIGGLVFSVLVGGGMMLGVLEGLGYVSMDIAVYGLVGGLCIALWYGGLDVIQHYIVRFLLWRSGSLPWRLAPFLDYAAEELHFLQKVGGGYIFVHRYLLEHFAAMDTDDGGPRTADRG